MSAALPQIFDCCQQQACASVTVNVVQSSTGTLVAVDTLADLRAIPAASRVPNLVVAVLSELGPPLDGTGWQAVWRPSDVTPDAPPNSVRPNDVATDADPGRWRQQL